MFEWITGHWQDLTLIATGLITVASIIVKLTPTETDNEVLEKIIKFFEGLGLNTKPVEKKSK